MNGIDILGQVLFFMAFTTPLITIPYAWKKVDNSKIVKVLVGIGLAIVLSVLLGAISLGIVLRNGLGPT